MPMPPPALPAAAAAPLAAHVRREAHQVLAHVEHAVLLEAQAVGRIRTVDERLDVLADELVELLKDDARLVLGERPHRGGRLPCPAPAPPPRGRVFRGSARASAGAGASESGPKVRARMS